MLIDSKLGKCIRMKMVRDGTVYFLYLLCIGSIVSAMDTPEKRRTWLSELPADVGRQAIAESTVISPEHRDNRRDYIIEQGKQVEKYAALAKETWGIDIDDTPFVETAVEYVRTHQVEEQSHYRPNVISVTTAMPSSREKCKQNLLKRMNRFPALSEDDKNNAVIKAVKRCPDIQVIKPMIEAGANVHSRDPGTLYTLLHYAVIKGETELAQYLLERGANPNTGDRLEAGPLHYAVRMGNHALASLLFTHGARPGLWDWYKNPPLLYAVKKGDERMVDLLLAKGASIYFHDMQGEEKEAYNDIFVRNVLAIAAAKRSKPLLKKLIEARLVSQPFESSLELMLNAALIIASQLGFEDIVQFLLNIDKEISFGNGERKPKLMPDLIITDHSAMTHALINNFFGLALTLLQYSSNHYSALMPHCRSSRSNSLRIAIEKRHVLKPEAPRFKLNSFELDAIINLFLQEDTNCFSGVQPSVCLCAAEFQDADLLNRLLTHAQEKNPQAPAKVLLQAATIGSAQAVRMLLQFPIDPNVRDLQGMRPLHKAAMLATGADISMISNLMQVGADPAARNERGETPLHFAMKHRNRIDQLEIVKKLLTKLKETQKRAEIDAQDNNGQTPLIVIAGKEGNASSVIQALAQYGAHVNQQDNKGQTALFLAAQANSIENVRALLLAKADPNRTNRSGCGPLNKAARHGNNEMIELLIKGGAQLDTFKDAMLREASKGSHLETMKWLLERGANINSRSTTYGNTPLHKAVLYKQLDAVIFLLTKKADTQVTNRKGEIPLECAISIPDQEIAELLMNRLA